MDFPSLSTFSKGVQARFVSQAICCCAATARVCGYGISLHSLYALCGTDQCVLVEVEGGRCLLLVAAEPNSVQDAVDQIRRTIASSSY
eukprot:469546-Rhodomonas_salina.3